MVAMIHPVGDLVPRIHPTAFVHPAAVVLGDVQIGAYSSVWPGAVLRGDYGPIRIGERTSIQDNCVVHARNEGTLIGSSCVFGHLAFAEEATIDDACLIGVGARVLNRVRLDRGTIAAAGVVIVPGTHVPAGMRIQGVPGRIVEHDGETAEEIAASAELYVAMAARVRASLEAAGDVTTPASEGEIRAADASAKAGS
jgi:carbonic anhydrase/acetyltransferase-like protein (isoleucine patch superfamily)